MLYTLGEGKMLPKGKKILIADDEPDLLKLLKFKLEKQGYEIILAHDGLETIEKIHSCRPDLILLDIIMPELDGETAVMKIKQDPELKDIPVIMMSALGFDHNILTSMGCGAEDYIIKPLDTEELLQKIEKALAPKKN
jgi:CheY-like chemotaxis protein